MFMYKNGLYSNLCPSVKFDSLLCSFTSISFLTNCILSTVVEVWYLRVFNFYTPSIFKFLRCYVVKHIHSLSY